MRIVLLIFAAFFLIGCSKPDSSGEYVSLLDCLEHPDRVCYLDDSGAQIETSYDRSGGNDDYNFFPYSNPDGWAVFADIQGPGLLTRFWCTGGMRPERRFRFYFDGEKKPRIDTTLAEMQSGAFPFHPQISRYEQGCWVSFSPIPFARRLKIMVDDWEYIAGKRKFYFQLNWLPLTNAPSSLPRRPDVNVLGALDRFAVAFETPPVAQGELRRTETTVFPASESTLEEFSGPGVIRELRLTPESFQPGFLRGAVLKMYWDGSTEPSVTVPLGDFFGSVWQRTRYQSRFFGLDGDTFVCRFPMPFSKSARIAVANESEAPLTLKTEARVSRDWKDDMGYFHAAWNGSGPNPGRPHPILLAKGRGKYVGCILSATSFDRSWWLLESDEYMMRDGETKPCWHGTGLEDYFNGGWYYKNVIARPLHGLVFKAPYRTVQYRLHDLDAVCFDEQLSVMLERGPGNASHGTFESTAFYYLEKPTAVALAAERTPPRDPHARYTLMSELANLERLGDYAGASEAIDAWLAAYPNTSDEPILRLRQIAYEEKTAGIEKARPLYEQFIAETDSAVAKQYAEQLLWFHESPDHALLAFYAKSPSRLSLDGRPLLTGGNPQRLSVIKLVLKPGQHALTIDAKKGGYPDWVQACLRTHSGLISTGPDWEFTFDNSRWYRVNDAQLEGPPAAPQVATSAHPFVDMQSQAMAVWTSEEWPSFSTQVLFRKVFEIP